MEKVISENSELRSAPPERSKHELSCLCHIEDLRFKLLTDLHFCCDIMRKRRSFKCRITVSVSLTNFIHHFQYANYKVYFILFLISSYSLFIPQTLNFKIWALAV
jgi:hypothetical protein